MATAVYRFRGTNSVAISRLERRVGAPLLLVANTGGEVVDLEADTSLATDLQDVMLLDGYEYLSTDPPGPPSDDFLPQSALNIAALDIVLTPPTDEVFGTVTGLSSMPAAVLGTMMRELGVTVQSGLTYVFKAYEMTADGFRWVLKVIDDEYWPGPGALTVRVQYIWS